MTADAHPNSNTTDIATFNLEAVIERFEDAWQQGLIEHETQLESD